MPHQFTDKPLFVLGVAALLLLLIGGVLGWLLAKSYTSREYESVRAASTNYRYIAPLLFVKTPEEEEFSPYQPLKEAMADVAERMQREQKSNEISVYFRNLNTSQWVGFNTEQRFSPSSMLKVATLIGILREAEANPKLLSSGITLPTADLLPDIKQHIYPPEHSLQPGKTYTVSKLLEQLIIESDNLAEYALSSLLGKEKIYSLYDDLQLPRPDASQADYTAQEYSRVFRTLYNATYLSKYLSEQVLEALTKTKFENGIVQGVPKGTVVAHKFGVRTLPENPIQHELHDCGIIYYPEHPYFLCIMTRGGEFEGLESALREVSSTVWQEVDRLHSRQP